jgi:hypothetical protein
MRIREIAVILRKDGFFHYNGRLIKAVYPAVGFGVLVFLEPSEIDKDFEANVWVPSAEELEQIGKALDESDRKTHELLGHGWNGVRPYWKLEDFM